MPKQDSTESRLAQLPKRTTAQDMLYRYSVPIEAWDSPEQQQRDKDMQEAVKAARASVRHQQEAYGYV